VNLSWQAIVLGGHELKLIASAGRTLVMDTEVISNRP
jgi:hypothetical protein